MAYACCVSLWFPCVVRSGDVEGGGRVVVRPAPAAAPPAAVAPAVVPTAPPPVAVAAPAAAEAVLEQVSDLLALLRVERLVDLGQLHQDGALQLLEDAVVPREGVLHRPVVELLRLERGGEVLAGLLLLVVDLRERGADVLERLADHLLLPRRGADPVGEAAQHPGLTAAPAAAVAPAPAVTTVVTTTTPSAGDLDQPD